MKFRKDLVTNSSSSSFICDICGYETSGYDMSYRDAGMYQCINGHEFCTHHALSLSREEMIKMIFENEWNEKYNYRTHEYDEFSESEIIEMENDKLLDFIIDSYSEVPAEICPICSMKSFDDADILKYLLKEKGMNLNEVFEEIKGKFSTYNEFKTWLKE